MTLFVSGLIIGFTLGWGIYWYLSQSEQPAFPWSSLFVSLAARWRGARRWAAVEPASLLPSPSAPSGQPLMVVDQEVIPPSPESFPEVVAYCASCRLKRRMQDLRPAEASDGRPAYRGTCEVCGAQMFVFRP